MAARGSKLQVTKVSGSECVTTFIETIEFTLLHCNNFDGNNNKFYIIEIQKNKDDEYQLFSNYGRLGKTSVYESRSTFKGSSEPITSLDSIKDEYDAIISKKEKGKTVKGVKEAYSKVDVISPTVGSINICESSNVDITSDVQVASDNTHMDITRIISQLTQDNIHNILSKTSLKLTSRGLETDIGIVTEVHIDKASSILNALREHIINDDDYGITSSNNAYFSLIPKKFGHKLRKEDMIYDADKLAESYDLLDSLKNALKTMVKPDKKDNSIKIDLSYLEDQVEWQRLETFFESKKHKNHSHLNSWKIKNIFKFNETDTRLKEYGSTLDEIGNDFELFHGSRNTNILSILINGFYVPPATAGHVTGRMFGNGIYLASCSTKALNYSTGFWDGKDDDQNAFIFIVQASMGNIEKCKKFKYDGIGHGYDSILGLTEKDGGSLLNEEYIVKCPSQTKITHLIELRK